VYLHFSKGFPTDHRCEWMDVDDSNVLGHNLEPILKHKARCLQCCNPQVLKRFDLAYVAYLELNGMSERGRGRGRGREVEWAAMKNNWTASQETEREAPDALRKEDVDQVLSKCRTLCMGNVDWCPIST
jgi:hypothetical protein